MRVLVECTHVYNHPHSNSGIQRVVRNISRQLTEHAFKFNCIPITYKKNSVYRIRQLKPSRLQCLLARIWQKLEMRRQTFWIGHANLEQRSLFSKSRNLRRLLYVLAHMLDFIFLCPIGAVRFGLHRIVDRVQLEKFDVDPGDVLVLLDSTWQPAYFKITERLKAGGVHIIGVIYDVIPITHPQFFETSLVNTYQRWFKWIANIADGFMTISKTVGVEALRAIQNDRIAMHDQSAHRRMPWFDHFYLGSELDLISHTSAISPDVSSTFAADNAVYLAVSTIEPRKNQNYLLDAFDLLWQKNAPVSLCIVGRIGWKCESLIRRIRRHPELGRRLFMHNDATDTELNYCYTHSKALLCPSIIEGFGLPIVEAMQRGLPVMASDIPVFREVGGDFSAYFDLIDPQSLADLILRYEQTGKFPAARDVKEWQWIDWSQAAKMLVEKILDHLGTEHAVMNSPASAAIRANYS